VLIGGLQAAGILENIAYWMSAAAGKDYTFLKLVYIIVIAAIGASFLNAGPSTVLFIPVVATMTFVEHTNIVWWALSIGVCIGSCATLAGATAGPVAITIYEKFMKKDDSLQEEEKTITFMEYSRMGLPLMGIFVLVSIIYIGILNYLS
jgi:Na+/H+ antiporter NhaD/arsenite permease-like protein